MNSTLIRKYDVPGPRYTSYPTVPFWKNDPMPMDKWIESLHTNYNKFNSSDISVYVHLPFCENLCTFCGCHKRITKNHQVESPYIDAVIKEWNLYKENLDFDHRIRELHFGGGTPTFFAPAELIRLLENLFNTLSVDPEECELSFEAHPNNTTEDHLKKLYDFGFRRLSLGVQDYNPEVQKAIHRIQPFETVEKIHNMARKMGYSSISHDLVFGLPKQSLDNIIETVSKTLLLKPDRISLYSYAHVPWIKGNGQRGFDENDLPKSEVKRELYETAKKMLESAGYLEIGMDHFALPEDSLSIAFDQKNLHRNFMGYTTMSTSMMIGLGMSAISDSWFAFAQNEKSVEGYIEKVNKGECPVYRGHLLTDQELETRKYILDLICHFETTLESDSSYRNEHFQIAERLKEMVTDGLVIIENDHVKVTEKGVPFVRNCCMAFDQHLQEVNSTEKMFSRTI